MQEKNKAPGPDEIKIEYFKYMQDDVFEMILAMLNSWRLDKELPEDLKLANVVTIYKKGKVDDPSNYRPIALLNTIYKLQAAMLRNRIIDGVYNRISNSQYGFRAKRPTAQPLLKAARGRGTAAP